MLLPAAQFWTEFKYGKKNSVIKDEVDMKTALMDYLKCINPAVSTIIFLLSHVYKLTVELAQGS